MKFDDTFHVWGRLQASKGFDKEDIGISWGDQIDVLSGAHIGKIGMIGAPGNIEVYHGGKVDHLDMCATSGSLTVFSGGVVGSVICYLGKITVKRGGLVTSADITNGAKLTVYSGGMVTEITKTPRAELDIRKGAIVTTIKTEDLNDEDEA